MTQTNLWICFGWKVAEADLRSVHRQLIQTGCAPVRLHLVGRSGKSVYAEFCSAHEAWTAAASLFGAYGPHVVIDEWWGLPPEKPKDSDVGSTTAPLDSPRSDFQEAASQSMFHPKKERQVLEAGLVLGGEPKGEHQRLAEKEAQAREQDLLEQKLSGLEAQLAASKRDLEKEQQSRRDIEEKLSESEAVAEKLRGDIAHANDAHKSAMEQMRQSLKSDMSAVALRHCAEVDSLRQEMSWALSAKEQEGQAACLQLQQELKLLKETHLSEIRQLQARITELTQGAKQASREENMVQKEKEQERERKPQDAEAGYFPWLRTRGVQPKEGACGFCGDGPVFCIKGQDRCAKCWEYLVPLKARVVQFPNALPERPKHT